MTPIPASRPDPAAFGLTPSAMRIAEAQVRVFRSRRADLAPLDVGLRAAGAGTDAIRALLDIRELASAELGRGAAVGPEGGDHEPARLRRRAWESGHLPEATEIDLAFRDLHPGLDAGVYAASHSMGVPSVAALAAVSDHLRGLLGRGIDVWDDGIWPGVMARYAGAVVELAGGDPARAAGVWFPNVSEALGALLSALPPEGVRDEVVFTAGHFTTGHYAHHQWAANTGGRAVVVPLDPDGTVPADRVVAAVGPSTRVVSISHALFESGFVQDVDTIVAGVKERAPAAVVLLDAYQTAGTVPLRQDAWGDRVVVVGGGHKQLRASAGAGWAVVPRGLLPELRVRRAGWWGHRDPWGFHKGPIERDEGTPGKLMTGTPTVVAMVHLLAELAVLSALGGGSLTAAVERVRARTSAATGRLIDQAASAGVEVRSPRDADRRGAFACLRFPRGREIAARLHEEGVVLDFRPDGPAAPGRVIGPDGRVSSGILRLSSHSAGFEYELGYALFRAVALDRELR